MGFKRRDEKYDIEKKIIDSYLQNPVNVDFWKKIYNTIPKLGSEQAKELLQKLYSLGAYKYAHFWSAVDVLVTYFPETCKDLHQLFKDAFEKRTELSQEAFSQYMHALRTLSTRPAYAETSKKLLKNLYRKGAYEYNDFWSVVVGYIYTGSYDDKFRELSKDFSSLFKDGFEKGAHKNSEYWIALSLFFETHPSDSDKLFKELYSLGFHKYPNFWSLRHPVENPVVFETVYTLLKNERDPRMYRVSGFWETLRKFISMYPEHSHVFYDHFKKGFEFARRNYLYLFALEDFAKAHPYLCGKLVDDLLNTYKDFSTVLYSLLHVRSHVPHPLLRAYRKIESEGFVSKETKELLRKWEHPYARYLSALAKARAWYLKDLLLSQPEKSSLFIKTAKILESKGFKVGWRTAKRIYEELPFMEQLSLETIESFEPKDINDFFKKIREKLKEKYSRNPLTAKFYSERDFIYLHHTLAYKKHSKHIEGLPKNPEDLFDYKFSHVPEKIKKRILNAAKNLEKEKHFVVTTDASGMIKALKEEAKNEELFKKEDEYSKTIQSAYEKIISRGPEAQLTEEELKAIKDTKKAKEFGLKETVSKIASILESARVSRGRIRIALTVPQHLAYMNVPGSCMRAGGRYSNGAIAITGGPGLVVGLEDHHGKVIGRVVLSLWMKKDIFRKKYILVPNHVYGVGGEEFMKKVRELLKSHGIEVHSEVKPPKGFRPAPSKHTVKTFWKDGHGETQFEEV